MLRRHPNHIQLRRYALPHTHYCRLPQTVEQIIRKAPNF
jgi:hypothetical protein